ncbi:major facilitator superfamily domain-containing protein 4A-like [Littorina saxatilis]|uniref:Uncharacterized protein n=1 Tax=Littorina saxatilis TaxID=31220 RepID=A0AAN9GJT8_9CAEN
MKHKAWGDVLEGTGTSQGLHNTVARTRLDAQQKRDRRDNILSTIFMCAASFACGMVTSQRGPSVLDLGYLTHSDLQRTASLFALGAGGHLTGCLATGLVYSQFQPAMFLFWSLVGLCAFTAAIPWCTSYGVMAGLYFISIFCVGCVETGTYADVARRWRNQGSRVLQMLQLSFVLGGVASPAFTRFFLMDTVRFNSVHGSTNGASAVEVGDIAFSNKSSVDNRTLPTHYSLTTTLVPVPLHNLDVNESLHELLVLKSNLSSHHAPASLAVRALNSMSDSNNRHNDSFYDYGPRPIRTKIHYAYIITAVAALIVAFPFIIRHWRTKQRQPKRLHSQESTSSNSQRRRQHRETSALVLVLAGALFFFATAVEESFHQFLLTYLTQESHWSAGMSALVTSWFWCGMLLVRLSAYFLPDNVPHEAVLTMSCVMLPCALWGLHASVADHSTDGVWACVFFVGMSCSLVFPVSFTWLHSCFNQKSGALSAVVMLSSSLAGVCNPLLLGYLFHEGFARDGFPYLLLGEACGALLAFILLFALSRWLSSQWLRATNTRIVLEKFVASTIEQQEAVDSEDSDGS